MRLLALMLLLCATPTTAGGVLGGLALGGNDPVLYFTNGKAMNGFKQHVTASDFMTYYFRTPETLGVFMENPEQYTPQFGGYCALQAAKGRMVAANPDIWTLHKGKLYFFRSTDSRDAWYLNPPWHITKAREAWAKTTGKPLPAPPPPETPSSLVPGNADMLIYTLDAASNQPGEQP